MAKFKKKPVVIEAITFDELVEYGKANGANIGRGMPWSFDYQGHPITHEDDECYLIPTLEGTMKFTPGDMLITGVQGEIYPCKLDIFEATYDVAGQCADGMTFGLAIEAAKKGERIARAGWNGKNMFVYFVEGSTVEVDNLRGAAREADIAAKLVADCSQQTSSRYICPHLDMKAADGSLVIGWLASQTDMLADDWMVVD